MSPIRRILAAIREPSLTSQPAAEKAAQLAAASGATLELLHVITTTMDTPILGLEGVDLQAFRQEREVVERQQLEQIASRLTQSAATVTTHVTWDYPVHEAIIRRATATQADLIVAGRHPEKHVTPWLLSYVDWELLRLSPMPVLLIKTEQPYRQPVILAALDPTHAHAKPAQTDEQILEVAASLQKALNGTLHAVHACVSLPVPINRRSLRNPGAMDLLINQAAEEANAAFAAVIDKAGLSTIERHFVDGSPIDVIPEVARRIGSHIVIMGAVSRSGLRSLFIGNTAQRVLGRLDCDVLVVKPAKFTSPV